jgi:hypothetical protein
MTAAAETLLRQINRSYPNACQVDFDTPELPALRARGLIYLSGLDSHWTITNAGRALFQTTGEAR